MSETHTDPVPGRTENLALIFQELLTVIERLRSNRQAVSDPESFRQHIREAVKTAAQKAKQLAGYPSDDIRMATLAVVGFLDETVLDLRSSTFREWPRRPLQEEFFGTHTAGEVFFNNLQTLLSRDDSDGLADLLEVYYLCLLLGYRGRYSTGDLHAVMSSTARKIRQIRGDFPGLSPDHKVPDEPIAKLRDRGTWRLAIGATACFLLAALAFVLCKLVLDLGGSRILAGA
jgi:type VI secretion system protein ImpK